MSGRAATIHVRLIENGDDITMHFEDDRFPPLWFNRKTRPVAHAKLRAILTEMQADVDEEREERAS
ncbi:MAG: hypothetical protein ACXVP3_01880 [Actinomycetota bacterium]